MPHDERRMGGYGSPKPETEIKHTQQPSPGGYDKDVVAINKVDEEAKLLGLKPPIGGHGQGGAGH